MKAYAGLSGRHPLPRFRVVLEDGLEVHVNTVSENRAREVATTMYHREVVSVELHEDESPTAGA